MAGNKKVRKKGGEYLSMLEQNFLLAVDNIMLFWLLLGFP